MKKTLLIISILFFINLQSQTEKVIDKKQKRLEKRELKRQNKVEKKQRKKERISKYVNPKGNWFFGAEIGSNRTSNSRKNEFLQGGLLAEYYFARHWSLSTKIKSFKTEVFFNNAATGGWFGHSTNSGSFSGQVITIPLNLKWEFRISKNLNGFLLFGYNYNTETKSEYSNYTDNYNTNNFPTTYFGGNVEYGINYYLNNKSALFLGFEHYYGSEKGKTSGGIISGQTSILTSNYLLNIGYKITLTKKEN